MKQAMGRPINADRALAISEHRRTYQGAECRRGHDGTRYVSNKQCVACGAVQSTEQRARGKNSTNY